MSIIESYVPCQRAAPSSFGSRVRAVLARLVTWAGGNTKSGNVADLDPRMLRDMGLPPEVDAWNESETLRRHRNLREPHLW